MRAASHARRLLRTHFLRRLLDNDLISPNADRHEVLVLLAAALAVPGLVVTVVLLGQKYVIGIPTPALTAVAALDDKFLYISASMLVMALIAAVQWDALALDERDTAILGPLPVSARDIGRAKLAALAMFVATFAIILNGLPSVIFPLLTVSHFHVDIVSVVRMIVTHAVVTMAAGAYAFLTVLLLRELLRLLVPAGWFRRVSAAVQAALVITLGTTLLLLPLLAWNVPAKWLAAPSALRTIPPTWFLGLYETGTGKVTLTMRGLRLRIPASLVVPEAKARLLYDSLVPRFTDLAAVALLAFTATTAAALGLYLWNNRRLPQPRTAAAARRGLLKTHVARLVATVVVPSPLQRAGFFFTLQTLVRSAPHRMAIAVACAVATAITVVLMQGAGPVTAASVIPLRVLAVQTIVVIVVLAGVRQALTFPAELRANWIFSMAWNEEVQPFVRGVKRAVVAGVTLPLAVALWGLHAAVLGPLIATQHVAVGVLLALIAIELLVRPQKLPLTCSAHAGDAKALAPIYFLLLVFGALTLASVERWALADVKRFAAGVCCLVLIYGLARLSPVRRTPLLSRIEADDLAEMPTQRLGLSEPV